ncbi:hypothetical protein DRH13_01670 [Candidatus Woesebacteria bacterium]|nr:MAG: hypothetical protein DRH13_01670 [Candidatus Woesebacteria bacterium]
MVIIEVECQCPERCGNSFKISEKTLERVTTLKDLVISLACPNTDLNKESVVERLDNFAVITKLEVLS